MSFNLSKVHYKVESNSNFYDFPSKHMSLISESLARIHQMALKNPVVIFSMSTCCMCLAVKRLFHDMAVNPTVYELDKKTGGEEMGKALLMCLQIGRDGVARVPVVFVGGNLVGSMDRVLAAHISGSLVPQLKEAGALWL